MKRTHARLLPLLLGAALACAACQPHDAAPAPPEDAATTAPATGSPVAQAPTAIGRDDEVRSGVPDPIELPPPGSPTPPMAEGADITYTCEDGSELRIGYAAGHASVTLGDGRIVPLARAPQAAQPASGELHAGDGLELYRLGNVVELQHDGTRRRCRESGGNA